MRNLPGYTLWLGHAGDARDLAALLAQGIEAMVDLSIDEPPRITRDLIYCRLPILDGGSNRSALLQLAILTIAELLRTSVTSLVYCSAGMSRTPTMSAAALALNSDQPLANALEMVVGDCPADVSPSLLAEVADALSRLRTQRTMTQRHF